MSPRVTLAQAARHAGLKEYIDFGIDIHTGRFWHQKGLEDRIAKAIEDLIG